MCLFFRLKHAVQVIWLIRYSNQRVDVDTEVEDEWGWSKGCIVNVQAEILVGFSYCFRSDDNEARFFFFFNRV